MCRVKTAHEEEKGKIYGKQKKKKMEKGYNK